MKYNYVIKSSDIARDRDTTVLVTCEVDVTSTEPKLVREQWLAQKKQSVDLMVDSEANRRELQEYSTARVQRALADAVIDFAARARVIDRLGVRNRYAGKCHATGRPVAEGVGFVGLNPDNPQKKAAYSFAYLCERFLPDVRAAIAKDPNSIPMG